MSAMFILKGSRDLQAPGTWWIQTWGDGEGKIVSVKCPNGHISTLWSNYPDNVPSTHHGISLNGTVTPSVVCPREACGFHKHIVLKDWEPKHVE